MTSQVNDIIRAVQYIPLLSVILGPNKASYSNYKLFQSQFCMQAVIPTESGGS